MPPAIFHPDDRPALAGHPCEYRSMSLGVHIAERGADRHNCSQSHYWVVMQSRINEHWKKSK
jgi:hypothetical protein